MKKVTNQFVEKVFVSGGTSLKYYAQNYFELSTLEDSNFVILDALEFAENHLQQHFFYGTINEAVLTEILTEWKEIVLSFQKPTFLISWFCNEADPNLHWLLEELYNVFRISSYMGTVLPTIFCNKKPLNLKEYYTNYESEIILSLEKCVSTIESWDLERMIVDVSLNENVLSARIDYNKPNTTDLYCFYLIHDGIVKEKTGWGGHCEYKWELKDDGIYVVQGYIKRNEYKVLRKSFSVEYFTDKGKQEFVEFLYKTEMQNCLNQSISFIPSQSPYCDILVVSGRQNVEQIVLDKELLHLSCIDVLQNDFWNTQIYSNGTVGILDNGENFLVSGNIVIDGNEQRGMTELSKLSLSKKNIEDSFGQYSYVVWNKKNIVLGNDYLAFKRWFYFWKEDLVVIANNYHLLLLQLRAMGIDLVLDSNKAKITLSSISIPMLHQNFSRQMDVIGVNQLTNDKKIILQNNWNFTNSNYGEIFNTNNSYHEREYNKYLDLAKEELLYNTERLLNNVHYSEYIVDLSGGLDSRIVYAIMTCLKDSKEKIKINSKSIPGSKDLEIATMINSIYNYLYNNYPEIVEQIPLNEADNLNRSYYLGTYYSHSLINTRKYNEQRVTLSGACGEVMYRPYIARKYLQTNLSVEADDEFFVEYLFRDWSNLTVVDQLKLRNDYIDYFGKELRNQVGDSLLEKLDRQYLTFRHGYHFDSITSLLGSHMLMPLQSKNMLLLHHMTFNVFKSIKLQFDILKKINPLLLAIPFDSDDDNADMDKLKNNLVFIDQRFEQIILNISSNVDAWNVAEEQRKDGIKYINQRDAAYQYMPEVMYNSLLNNFRLLMINNRELCNEIGCALYHQFKKIKNDSRKINYWYNKVTSLMDQMIICQQNDIVCE